jgi:hypothetical protein
VHDIQHARMENISAEYRWKNLDGRRHFGHNRRLEIILKLVFDKCVKMWIGFKFLKYGTVTDCYEHTGERSSFFSRGFMEQTNKYQLVKEGHGPGVS